jgi:hypothetical protein
MAVQWSTPSLILTPRHKGAKLAFFNFAPLPFVFEFDVSSIGYYQAEILPSGFPFILGLMQQLGIVSPDSL